MSANLEDRAVATGLENVDPHPNSQEDSTKKCSNHQTIALISHDNKVMLKILHARLQYYVNQEHPSWVLEKAGEPEINCQHFQDQRESKGIPEKHIPLFHRRR